MEVNEHFKQVFNDVRGCKMTFAYSSYDRLFRSTGCGFIPLDFQ
ncbi:MAG: hypothetical protein BECKG1743D_GA0114223_104297 [Candidatus Kentron sp. G]|nr:MAG: hypothetical protein BECKG1743F_GA0114225_105876 [Candidatus Kentron sp. G]VFN02533.1 MAG: hypothetical protein BECKG1743E_GA0114224_105171 [Candidatus Kentron sp. G]VFN03091.1 MAG: hypothetical protein BECKG1743D_GA0114223_104297 [Candidatus Kentron sp. G]